MNTINLDDFLNWISSLMTIYQKEYANAKKNEQIIEQMIAKHKISLLEMMQLYLLLDTEKANGIWMPLQEEPFANEKLIIWNGYEWNEGVYIKSNISFDEKNYDTGFYVYVPGMGYIMEEDIVNWMRIVPPGEK